MPLPAYHQRLLSIARFFGVLPWLEKIHFRQSCQNSASENAEFLAKHPKFKKPPLWWMHDMYAHTSYRQYWMSGKRDAAQIMAHIERFSDGPIQHVAEWGCGLARILRHLPKELIRTGYDYNPEAIKWGQENLRQIRFYHNDLMPPLECEADSVDAVYSISVFTHLSQAAHHAWIDELYRILRPGGLLLFTVHGCPPEGLLLPHEQAQFDKGALVTRGKVLEGSRIYTAYHPKPYVRERLLAQFHILAGPVPEFGQTLWIAQKPIA